MEPPLDLAVVIALREEFRELVKLFGASTPGGTRDVKSYLFVRNGYRCVATFVGEMGEAAATSITERLIAQWEPASIVVAGITGGVHGDLRVGDVFVPSQAVAYLQDGKVVSKRTGKPDKRTKGAPATPEGSTFKPGGPAFRADWALLSAAGGLEFDHPEPYERWRAEGRADLKALIRSKAARERLVGRDLVRGEPALVVEGHLATGPVVVADAAFVASTIQAHDRNVKGIEMESAAVLRAAQSREQPVRALAIRGISDYGDARKQALDAIRDGALRKYAMRNAVRLLCALLDAEALPRAASWAGVPPLTIDEGEGPVVFLSAGLPAPAPPAVDVHISRLPSTGRDLFGREAELAWLDACWDEGVRVASIVASGGVGKSSLVNGWLRRMDAAGWRGATRVYGWSFYSQGTDRLASSDAFFDAALRRFGETGEAPRSPWEKGERLAALVRKERAILVLDGVEPLQWGPGVHEGKLKDPALEALLKELGAQNEGLCVVTSRIALTDMDGIGGDKVRAKDLGSLSPEAGAELLRARGAMGTDEELRKAAEEYKGHGLALTLLGSYLAEVAGGDIRRRKEIGPLEEDERVGGHARRVMRSYDSWLGKPELAILHMIGLFDRPAEEDEIAALRAEPVVRGLTDALAGAGGPAWSKAVAKLRRVGLLAEQGKKLDTHPLVREHYGEQLRREQPEAWREGHRRLYEHLKKKAKPLPETVEEMAPLYAAVVHGCQAGKSQEALDEVLWTRIQREKDGFSVKKLGAFGSEVAVLSAFFDPPWERLAPGLSELWQAFVLNEAGFALRALGRLPEAVALLRLGLERYIAQESWENAAAVASNLSELLQARGALSEALAQARRSVELADESGDAFWRMVTRTTLAAALHAAGLREEAAAQFEEAEWMQKKRQPANPRLYSLPGFQYCDLLLDQGRDAEVRERAAKAMDVATRNHWLLDIALDHLSLGRADILAAQRGAAGDLSEAASQLQQAVDGLRRAGRQDYLALGLVARAALHTYTRAFAGARRDLDEALTLATRCGFRLHEADAHLGLARLALADDNPAAARDHRDRARAIIEATGYHRRDRDLAELDAACG
jgi:nucleoside phosphorylase/tetratricopeptide (TPR) repeat protein